MTRKRFIKLYMSYGYSRDEANFIALYAWCISGNYKAYYNSFQSISERHAKKIMKGTVKAWQQLNKQVQTIVPQAMGILEAPLKGIAQVLNLM